MKLILHIGTEKTGTTALQCWLHENAKLLRRKGVWYAQCLGLPNNRALSVASRRWYEREDGFQQFGIETREDHAAFRARTLAALAQDVAAARAAGARFYVISSEHCHSRLRKQEMVDRVAAALLPLFDDAEVHCFLRPQVDLAVSRASTGARVGLHVSKRTMNGVRPENLYYDYERLLARWANAFGAERVHPVPLRRHARPVAWYMKRLGLDPAHGYSRDRRINGALDYRVVALSNLLVGPHNRRGRSSVPPMHRAMFLERLHCDRPLSLSRAEARLIQSRFDDSNARLCAAWPQIAMVDLAPDLAAYPEQGTFDLLDGADVSAPLREVLGRFSSELAMAQGRVAILESRAAEAEGDLRRAAALMEPAIAQIGQARQVATMTPWAGELHAQCIDRRAALTSSVARAEARAQTPAPRRPVQAAPDLRAILRGLLPARVRRARAWRA